MHCRVILINIDNVIKLDLVIHIADFFYMTHIMVYDALYRVRFY